MYVLNKITYGDFDIAQAKAVAVSDSKGTLETAAAEMNARRTTEEVEKETHYEVQNESVRVL